MSPSNMDLHVRDRGSKRFKAWQGFNHVGKFLLGLKMKEAIRQPMKKQNPGAEFGQQSEKAQKKTLTPGETVSTAP